MRLLSDLTLSRVPLTGFVAMGVIWSSFASQAPVIKAQIGASDGLYGALLLLGSLGALAAIWLAPLADRIAGRRALMLGILLMASGFLLMGPASSPVAFVVALLVASVGAGITDVVVNADLSHAEAKSGRALMNLNHGLFSVAYAGSALCVGVLREAAWTPTQIFALVGCILLVLSVFAQRPKMIPSETAPDAPATPVPWLFVISAGIVVMVAFLAEATVEGWSALHLERTLGGGPAEGTYGPAILGISMGIGRLGGHWLSHRLPDVPTMIAALLLAALGLCLAGSAPGLVWAYVGFGLAGLGMSVVGPLGLSLLGRSVPPAARLQAISKASAIAYMSFVAGPLLIGGVSEVLGLRMSFVTVALLLGLVAVFLVPSFGRQARAF